jgi:hypothetical protein
MKPEDGPRICQKVEKRCGYFINEHVCANLPHKCAKFEINPNLFDQVLDSWGNFLFCCSSLLEGLVWHSRESGIPTLEF